MRALREAAAALSGPPRQCTTLRGNPKRVYGNLVEAHLVAAKLTARRGRSEPEVQAYWCGEHRGYHLGRVPRWWAMSRLPPNRSFELELGARAWNLMKRENHGSRWRRAREISSMVRRKLERLSSDVFTPE